MTHTVLIVDDSKLARMVAGGALARIRPDWSVAEATNAEEALAAMTAQAIDIALIDFNMPGTNGLTLATAVRDQNPEMPIALVSANIQDEVVARARAIDAVFLPKPVTDDSLARFLSGAALRLRRKR